MATLLARLTVVEGREGRFEALCRSLYTASHESEPDLVRYEYLRSTDPRVYYCLLSFTDEAAFLRHQASDHHEGATAELRDLIESGRFEWVDPVEGASPLVTTSASGPADGASDVELAYHRAMGVEVAGWWPGR